MVMIYTDAELRDVGEILRYQLDMSYGAEENDFELVTPKNECGEMRCGSIVYADGGIGGMIDGFKSSNDDDIVTWSGRTFSGLLNSRVVSPPNGSAYYTDSGDAKAVIRRLIANIGAGDLFYCDSTAAGFSINCKWRYARAYDGLSSVLFDVGARLVFGWSRELGKIVIDVEQANVISNVDNDNDFILTVSRFCNTVNHLVCLGKGELEERTVIHLYLDANGNVTTTQYYTGNDEYVEVFDYPNAESVEQLATDGAKKLLELAAENNNADLQIADGQTDFDIGDKIHATEFLTGISVNAVITQKIIKSDGETVTTSYKVGG